MLNFKVTSVVNTLSIVLVLLLLMGGSSIFAEEMSKDGNITLGAKLWSENCARCHNMRNPGDLSDQQWITSVYHMRIRAGLTGQETRDILAFLQSASATTARTARNPVTESVAQMARSGEEIYRISCTACHGDGGQGKLPGVPDLTDSKGRLTKRDDELLANMISGLQTPGNLMAMPPKGGNAELTAGELGAALGYLRSMTGIAPDD